MLARDFLSERILAPLGDSRHRQIIFGPLRSVVHAVVREAPHDLVRQQHTWMRQA
jgi:hypothetical protein